VLVPEGFSFGAFFFGPLWLALHRAFIPAVLVLAADVAAALLLPGGAATAAEFVLALFAGVSGRDLVRWSLGLHGFRATHVLAARDWDSALARLLAVRPDLGRAFLPEAG